MSSPKELLTNIDTALAEVLRSINELSQVSVAEEELLNIYSSLIDYENHASNIANKLRDLIFTISVERAHRWAIQDRYYVYISFRYGKPVEASLYSLGESSGSSWHDLHYAARHWQRMEEIGTKPDRNSREIHYAIMSYSPVTGQIRKVDQAEIDTALAERSYDQ